MIKRCSVVLPLLLLLGACTARPGFIPPPQRAFADHQALPRPTRELAVGALWIKGHGTYGSGADPANLETLAGISTVVIDNDLGASLSLGFLQYLDLDPTLQSKVVVRLNDVTLVRVKDMARLDGPKEQPRVYEALRVGSATITTTKEVGLAIEARAAEVGLPVFGRGSSGRRSVFTIEAKDVFLAVRIATQRSVSSAPLRVRLGSKRQSLALKGLSIEAWSTGAESCEKGQLSASKGFGVVVSPWEFDPRTASEVRLAAPVADRSALFDRIAVEPDRSAAGECVIRLTLRGAELVGKPS